MDLGIVPQDASRREMNSTDDWDALSPAEQQYEAKRMAVYAGMVSAMDAEIGRLQNFLAERGKLANTLFIFTSDNGAEASGAPKQDTAGNRWSLSRQGYSIDESTLGTQGSFNTISPSFASAAASRSPNTSFTQGKAACACRSLFLVQRFRQRMGSRMRSPGRLTSLPPFCRPRACLTQTSASPAGPSCP